MKPILSPLAAGAAVLFACSCAFEPSDPHLAELQKMDGFVSVLEKGAIPAVNDPVFVPAASAEIADDAWVIGVFDGENAKAYSINILNEHEIVNDVLSGRPIATTW